MTWRPHPDALSDDDESPNINGRDQLNFFPFAIPQWNHLHPNTITKCFLHCQTLFIRFSWSDIQIFAYRWKTVSWWMILRQTLIENLHLVKESETFAIQVLFAAIIVRDFIWSIKLMRHSNVSFLTSVIRINQNIQNQEPKSDFFFVTHFWNIEE